MKIQALANRLSAFVKYYMALAAVAVSARAVAADTSGNERRYVKSEHMVTMRDGTRQYVAIYAPEGIGEQSAEKAPILWMRTPYSCAPYGDHPASFVNDQIYKPYADAGYIFAFQDVRGRWMSEGDSENVTPMSTRPDGVDDVTDAYDTIEWLVDSVPGNNGRVGVYGNSYCGYYALVAAASRHPALRAASPQAPVCDWFAGDDFHHNGAFAVMPSTFFAPCLVTEKNHRPSPQMRMPECVVSGNPREFFLNNTIADVTARLDGRVEFWDSIMAHPYYDDFWKKRYAGQFTNNLITPILVVGGHFDAEDLYGALRVYRDLRHNSPRLPVTLAMGPWSHGQWRDNGAANRLGEASFGDENLAIYYRDNIEFPFFDYYLRDNGNRPDKDHIFISGENHWFTGKSADISTREWSVWLAADSTLSVTPPRENRASIKYTSLPSDPVPFIVAENSNTAVYMTAGQRFLDGRKDVLSFISPVLTDTLRFVGSVTPELFVSITTTDADFVVKLIDVAPDGKEMLVRGDIFRGRYRHSLSAPEPFIPDQVEKLKFAMPDIAHTFLPGHRMKVQIQSSWFPLFDMNPQQFIDIYKARREDFVPSDITVYCDASHPSRIILRLADGNIFRPTE